MVSDTALYDLKEIIASEYHVVLTMEEVQRIAKSLISLYSVLLKNNNTEIIKQEKL